MVHPYRWLRTPDLVPLAPFLQCEPCLTPGGSGVLSDPVRIDEEFRKAWLPYFCRSGQRETSLEEFNREVEGWLPILPEVSLPALTGDIVFYLILIRLMQNSERLGFPIFAVLGKGRPTLTNSALRLMGGCRFFLRFIYLG